jgi:hypothetical protein
MSAHGMPWRIVAAAIGFCVAGCSMAPPPVAMSSKGAVEMRAMETRIYPVGDRGQAMRSVIAALQDLGYSMDKVRGSTGTVTAFKLNVLRVSVAVTPHGPGQMAVRANAEVMVGNQFHQVDDPRFYEADFFQPLSAAMSLSAAAAQDEDAAAIPVPDSLYSQPSS